MLELHNEYSFDRFSLRKYQCDNLDELEQQILAKQTQVLQEHEKVQEQVHKTFESIMDSDAEGAKDGSLKAGIESLSRGSTAGSTSSSKAGGV